jgi:hypothetical protein
MNGIGRILPLCWQTASTAVSAPECTLNRRPHSHSAGTLVVALAGPSRARAIQEHAGQVAQHIGSEHTELYVTPPEPMAAIPEFPRVTTSFSAAPALRAPSGTFGGVRCRLDRA